MNDDITVRFARFPDQPAVVRLINQIFPDSPFAYAGNICYPQECVNVVAESTQSEIVGFASLLIHATPQQGSEEWRKHALYVAVVLVSDEYRRRGIASRMLDLIASTVQKTPYDCLHLHVFQDNEAGMKCFEKYGFERVTEYRDKQSGRKSWLMQRTPRVHS